MIQLNLPNTETDIYYLDNDKITKGVIKKITVEIKQTPSKKEQTSITYGISTSQGTLIERKEIVTGTTQDSLFEKIKIKDDIK